MAHNIKNLKPNFKSKFKQGYFNEAKKYVGKYPIIYRSSLELKYMKNLEINPLVEKWSSEQIVIPYLMQELKEGKLMNCRHNYNTDFTVYYKDGRKFIIEIKPSSLIPLNETQINRITHPEHYKNACKWKFARQWCKQNGFQFCIITEEHLNNKKSLN